MAQGPDEKQYRTRLDRLAAQAGMSTDGYLRKVLTDGTSEEAAETLGVTRITVWRWRKRYLKETGDAAPVQDV